MILDSAVCRILTGQDQYQDPYSLGLMPDYVTYDYFHMLREYLTKGHPEGEETSKSSMPSHLYIPFTLITDD